MGDARVLDAELLGEGSLDRNGHFWSRRTDDVDSKMMRSREERAAAIGGKNDVETASEKASSAAAPLRQPARRWSNHLLLLFS